MAGRARNTPSRDAGSDVATAAVHALPVSFADDAALARAAARRHPAAARAVWQRFSTLVRGLLRRTLGPGREVEDEVQEVFLRFFNEAPKLRDPAKLRSFIVGITMRVARGELRKRRARRWLQLSASGDLPSVAKDGEDLEARAALARLYRLLDRVDSKARVLFILRHVEQLELPEIAEVMGCSLATAKRHIRRACDRIVALARRDPALSEYVRAATDSSRKETER